MATTENASGIGIRHLRSLLAALATATVAVAMLSSGAAAAATPGMSIAFPSRTAGISGPGALVPVKCVGTESGECTGTLTVEGLAKDHSVSYAVAGGEQRSLVVPLGRERHFFTGIAAPKMRVAADTMQSSGGSVRTVRVLRFR